jgi:hypothetical protein
MPSASEEKDLECALSDSFAPLTSHTIKTQSTCPFFSKLQTRQESQSIVSRPFDKSLLGNVRCQLGESLVLNPP